MKKVFWISGALLICVLLIWLLSTSGTYYRTYSPDRQYSVYAKKYNWASLIPRSPGGGSDAPGRVFLFDEVEKRVIGQAKISMVGNASNIEWDRDIAYFIGDDYPNILKPWKLPRPIKGMQIH